MNVDEKKINGTNDLLQLVGFKVDSEEFGVDISIVQEIIRLLKITKLPSAPEYLEGVVNIRGRIIPIIKLRNFLQLPQKEFDGNTRIIVIEVGDNTVGFIVDAVTEVLRILSDITEPLPELTTSINSEFINSVAKLEDRLLILLDINKILEHVDAAKSSGNREKKLRINYKK